MNSEILVNQMAQKLSELRAAKGITQETLADVLGISNKTISKWENGASSPEIEYISMLADYYDVTIDELFGKQGAKISVHNSIANEYKDLSCADGIKKSFELSLAVIRGCIRKFFNNLDDSINQKENTIPSHIVSENNNMVRSVISHNSVYELLINNKDTNMSVMLLQNESNFEWIKNRGLEFTPVFEFLSDVDALKVIYCLYSENFSGRFTAEFMAKKVNISTEKVIELLEKAIKINLCYKSTANLQEGNIELYSSYSNGMVLSIVALAYEYMCGSQSYEFAYLDPAKMIREEK